MKRAAARRRGTVTVPESHPATPDALPDGREARVAIVSARFYAELSDWLEDGARRALRDCGVDPAAIALARVPGCFELPLAAQRIIAAGRCDAVVALGVVIRGETPHFEYVAGECARGIMTVQLATGVPIGFGVLTTESLEQARERADPNRGDKGYEAAIAALSVLGIERRRIARDHVGKRRVRPAAAPERT